MELDFSSWSDGLRRSLEETLRAQRTRELLGMLDGLRYSDEARAAAEVVAEVAGAVLMLCVVGVVVEAVSDWLCREAVHVGASHEVTVAKDPAQFAATVRFYTDQLGYTVQRRAWDPSGTRASDAGKGKSQPKRDPPFGAFLLEKDGHRLVVQSRHVLAAAYPFLARELPPGACSIRYQYVDSVDKIANAAGNAADAGESGQARVLAPPTVHPMTQANELWIRDPAGCVVCYAE
ncbi:hypothetical protein DIPPA_13433 [Diplonema papillatum]|nr:hypothetical protein DIPPA_13433 [Diplonema papillatum]